MDSLPGQPLRLRIFAGPNGSGKSTIIKSIQNYRIGSEKINFGVYINADDIAEELKTKYIDFGSYGIRIRPKKFHELALLSGLTGKIFSTDRFTNSYSLRGGILKLKEASAVNRLAQIITEVLRQLFIEHRIRFSFETVFSHRSKLDIMQKASEAGYKVYLYFVSTEDPSINDFRVRARVAKGGHSVPANKIISRYDRSLDLLYEASQLAYQVFFFDNSEDGKDFRLFAHFRIVNGKKEWSITDEEHYPGWFKKYYLAKISAK